MEARSKSKLAVETLSIDSKTDVIEEKDGIQNDLTDAGYNTGLIFKRYFLKSKEGSSSKVVMKLFH